MCTIKLTLLSTMSFTAACVDMGVLLCAAASGEHVVAHADGAREDVQHEGVVIRRK
jgi:hypothetical protein